MNNKQNWNEQENMMAVAVINIANSLPYILQQMKQYIKKVQNNGGVINDGSLQEMLDSLSDMINSNLRNVSQSRVNITLTPLINTVSESKSDKNKVYLTENQIQKVIEESISRIFR
jgi:replication fork clamp-binding protein CrfC